MHRIIRRIEIENDLFGSPHMRLHEQVDQQRKPRKAAGPSGASRRPRAQTQAWVRTRITPSQVPGLQSVKAAGEKRGLAVNMVSAATAEECACTSMEPASLGTVSN